MSMTQSEQMENDLRWCAKALREADPAERKRIWDLKVRPALGEFVRLRLGEIAAESNVRDVGAKIGISGGYVSMLTRDEEPRNASLSVVESIANAYPQELAVVRDLLAVAPEAARLRLAKEKTRKSAPGRSGVRPEEWSVSFNGRRREEPVWHNLLRSVRHHGATDIVRVDGDWLSPVVEPGDLALLAAVEAGAPKHRMLAMVHTSDGQHALREYDAATESWRLPNDEADDAWSAATVRIDGELVGVLKMRRL